MEVGEHPAGSGASSQRSSPAVDKLGREVRGDVVSAKEAAAVAVLDGSSPPVQTIIFENTNYRQGPSPADAALKPKIGNHLKSQKLDRNRGKEVSLLLLLRRDLTEAHGEMQGLCS